MTHCLSPRIFVEVEKRESFRLQLFCLALLEKAALIRLYSGQRFDHNRPGWVEEALNISWGRYLWASASRRMRMCRMALYWTITLCNSLLRVTEVFVLLVGGNVGEKTFVYSWKGLDVNGCQHVLGCLTELHFYFLIIVLTYDILTIVRTSW